MTHSVRVRPDSLHVSRAMPERTAPLRGQLYRDAVASRGPCDTHRSYQVIWSAADNPNTRVQARVMKVLHEIADVAGVGLQLSSGLRPGDKSNHGVGRAVDVNAINGVDVGTGPLTNPAAVPLVEKVQAAARAHPEVRENFGPAGLWKSPRRGKNQLDFNDGSPRRTKLQGDHMDHIHISVHP
jgi:hypothetical protein